MHVCTVQQRRIAWHGNQRRLTHGFARCLIQVQINDKQAVSNTARDALSRMTARVILGRAEAMRGVFSEDSVIAATGFMSLASSD